MRHRAITSCLFGLLLAIFSAASFAAEDYEQVIGKFFSILGEGKTTEATDYLFSSNPWMGKAGVDQIQNVKTQISSLPKLMGTLRSKEKIIEEKVGDNYIYLVYLGLYDRQPIRFKFNFYRPDGKWRFQNFSFDTNVAEDVEKQADQKLITGKR
jgi:hypothetical protein